jgi:hypothetical protein
MRRLPIEQEARREMPLGKAEKKAKKFLQMKNLLYFCSVKAKRVL